MTTLTIQLIESEGKITWGWEGHPTIGTKEEGHCYCFVAKVLEDVLPKWIEIYNEQSKEGK